MERVALKSNAKAQLKGKWALAVVTLLVGTLIINGFSGIITFIEPKGGILSSAGGLVSIFLGGTITLGISKFVLNIATCKDTKFEDLFSGFNIYLKTLGLWILMALSIGIATIFFIIPGIIVSLMLSQAFFILCEDNEKSITDCLKESSEMMKGHKFELFVLGLSFIGWWIVVIITCGIAFLWVYPYQEVTFANYYLGIKRK